MNGMCRTSPGNADSDYWVRPEDYNDNVLRWSPHSMSILRPIVTIPVIPIPPNPGTWSIGGTFEVTANRPAEEQQSWGALELRLLDGATEVLSTQFAEPPAVADQITSANARRLPQEASLRCREIITPTGSNFTKMAFFRTRSLEVLRLQQ